MMGRLIGGVPGSLALVARRGTWWRLSWGLARRRPVRRPAGRANADDKARRLSLFRYHLGRGRRAREAGRFELGATEARRALALYPSEPWALALLGQCLQRQAASDLHGARRALERAWALDQTNGYFVGLLLDVLRAQGDAEAARSLLEWAWWRGAPVERWLPDGPAIPAAKQGARGAERAGEQTSTAAPPAAPDRRGSIPSSRFEGRQPVPA